MDTDQVKGFLFQARASLEWPEVLTEKSIRFPLTQVGNSSFYDLVLQNPSTMYSLYVHLVPKAVYPNAKKLEDMLLKSDSDPHPPLSNSVSSEIFRIVSVLDANTRVHLKSFMDEVETKTRQNLHQETKAFVLKPSQTAKVIITEF